MKNPTSRKAPNLGSPPHFDPNRLSIEFLPIRGMQWGQLLDRQQLIMSELRQTQATDPDGTLGRVNFMRLEHLQDVNNEIRALTDIARDAARDAFWSLSTDKTQSDKKSVHTYATNE